MVTSEKKVDVILVITPGHFEFLKCGLFKFKFLPALHCITLSPHQY